MSVNSLGAQKMVLPLFQLVPFTVCPSKSRNIVAVAEGKLLNLGKLNALREIKEVKTNNFR